MDIRTPEMTDAQWDRYQSDGIRELIKQGKLYKGMLLKTALDLLFCSKSVYKTRAKYIWTWGYTHLHFSPKRKGQNTILMNIVEDLLV